MAQFHVEGLDGLEDFFGNIAAIPDKVIDKMLNAEADVSVIAQKRTTASMWSGPYSTGVSSNSIKKGRPKKTKDGRVVSITFKGSRTRANTTTSNAEIAFVQEFGKRGQDARPAIKTANEGCADEAVEAAGVVFDEFLNSF